MESIKCAYCDDTKPSDFYSKKKQLKKHTNGKNSKL